MAKQKLGIVAILLLAACATVAQRQYQAIVQTNTAAVADLKSCLQAVYQSPQFAPLQAHVPLDIRDATLDQLTDTATATPEQIAAIKTTHPQISECRKTYLQQLTRTTPSIAVIYTDDFNKADAALIQLIQRKISWGEYTTERKERLPTEQKEIVEEGQRITAGLQQMHENELEQRRAAAKALTDYAQTQEMIDAINRPVITNCTGFGNDVNCISR